MSRLDNLWNTQARHSQQSLEYHLPDKAPFIKLLLLSSFQNTLHILFTEVFPFLSVPSITLFLLSIFLLPPLLPRPLMATPVGLLPGTQHAHRHACQCFETLPDRTREGWWLWDSNLIGRAHSREGKQTTVSWPPYPVSMWLTVLCLTLKRWRREKHEELHLCVNTGWNGEAAWMECEV